MSLPLASLLALQVTVICPSAAVLTTPTCRLPQIGERALVVKKRLDALVTNAGPMSPGTISDPILRVREDGRIYLIDRLARVVRVVDSFGESLPAADLVLRANTWIKSTTNAGWIRDTLWLVDQSANRILMVPSSGANPRALPLLFEPPKDGFGRGVPIAVLPDGNDLLIYGVAGSSVTPSGVTIPVLIGSRDGQVLRSLTTIPIQHATPAVRTSGGSTLITYQPFNDDPLFEVSPGGEFAVQLDRRVSGQQTGTMRMTCFDLTRGTAAIHDFSYIPVPLPLTLSAEARRRGVEHLVRRGTLPEAHSAADWISRHLFIPPVLPPVDALAVGREGAVYLRLSSASADSAVWQRTSCRAPLEGRLILPLDARVAAVSTDRVWAIRADSTTGQWRVLRYEVSYAQE